jgi:hypothetical protein
MRSSNTVVDHIPFLAQRLTPALDRHRARVVGGLSRGHWPEAHLRTSAFNERLAHPIAQEA